MDDLSTIVSQVRISLHINNVCMIITIICILCRRSLPSELPWYMSLDELISLCYKCNEIVWKFNVDRSLYSIIACMFSYRSDRTGIAVVLHVL